MYLAIGAGSIPVLFLINDDPGRHPVRAAAEAAEESFRASQKADSGAVPFAVSKLNFHQTNKTAMR